MHGKVQTDVVLVKVNRPETMADSPPFGLLYLSSALKSAGFCVLCLHVGTDRLAEAAAQIQALCPLWVGFSVFSGDCMADTLWLSRTLSQAGLTTVWGNAHPTLCPEQCLAEDGIHICVLSEGEETAIALTRALHGGTALDLVAGLAFKAADGSLVRTPIRPFLSDLDSYGPDLDALDLEPYVRDYGDGMRTLPIVASRGCPHSCGICYNEVFNRRRWRRHSPAFIHALVAELARRYHLDAVRFMDDYFFASTRWAFQVLEGLPLPWRGAAYPSDVDDAFVARLGATRCRAIVVELEGVEDRVLAASGKWYDRRAVEMAVERLNRLDQVAVIGSIIFAYPGESRAEFIDALSCCVQLMARAPNVLLTCGWYRPYPGTPLWRSTLEAGFDPPASVADWDRLDRWQPRLERIDWVPWADIDGFARLDRIMETVWRLHRRGHPRLRQKLMQAIVAALNPP